MGAGGAIADYEVCLYTWHGALRFKWIPSNSLASDPPEGAAPPKENGAAFLRWIIRRFVFTFPGAGEGVSISLTAILTRPRRK